MVKYTFGFGFNYQLKSFFLTRAWLVHVMQLVLMSAVGNFLNKLRSTVRQPEIMVCHLNLGPTDKCYGQVHLHSPFLTQFSIINQSSTIVINIIFN